MASGKPSNDCQNFDHAPFITDPFGFAFSLVVGVLLGAPAFCNGFIVCADCVCQHLADVAATAGGAWGTTNTVQCCDGDGLGAGLPVAACMGGFSVGNESINTA